MADVLNTNLAHNVNDKQQQTSKIAIINGKQNIDTYLSGKSYIDPKTGEIFMFVPDENGEIVLAYFEASCFTVNKR